MTSRFVPFVVAAWTMKITAIAMRIELEEEFAAIIVVIEIKW